MLSDQSLRGVRLTQPAPISRGARLTHLHSVTTASQPQRGRRKVARRLHVAVASGRIPPLDGAAMEQQELADGVSRNTEPTPQRCGPRRHKRGDVDMVSDVDAPLGKPKRPCVPWPDNV